MSRFLIRVYGDSLSLPRKSEGVSFIDSYPELLADTWQRAQPGTRVHLYNRSFSNATATRILETYHSDSFYFGRPGGDVLILQCGVVDCAPRPLPQRLRNAVSRLPELMRIPIVRFLHERRATLLNSGLMWRVTPPEIFLRDLTNVLRKMAPESSSIYVLNIAPTTPAIEAHSPGFSESIVLYNSLISEAVAAVSAGNTLLIDVHGRISALPNGVETMISKADGHHITAAGHKLYADAILEAERRSVSSSAP